MPTLVIVESPTKARTISRFLPSGYQVEACMGHVRDLPGSAAEIPPQYKGLAWAKDYGINVDKDFEPLYVIPQSKRKIVTELRAALKKADALIIATDEDREGESIGWHLTEVLQPKVPVRRMVFHEITRSAIEEALVHERDIDQNLVRAQEARRILDRLVGYTVSPVLWVKIAPGLSAGRVQSVAVRLLVARERERRAFRIGSYWELKSTLAKTGQAFEAMLARLGGKRVASGRDFDETTGKLKGEKDVVLLGEKEARALAARLKDVPWRVTDLERKPRVMRPYPPFTTSTLQQEANRKLGLSSAETMRIAQRLYEQGLITYMRTDSVNLSKEAIAASRHCVETRYGAAYLSEKPRQFTTKQKGAQEAHEAIRPAGEQMLTADETGLIGRDKALYELIWKRTVATQMADSSQEIVTISVTAEDAVSRASGKRILFPGFLRAYVEGSDDPSAALEDREVLLPDVAVGDVLDLRKLEPLGRETRPPGRFTEASLVEKLEKEGIGRPSTYATIIDTILSRDYARKATNTLVPTFTAFGVTQLMEGSFDRFVDTGFTATMEEQLDAVAKGEADWLPWLRRFWSGATGLLALVTEGREKIDPRAACTLAGFDDLAAKVRIGRYGPYLEVMAGETPVRASIPDDVAPADLSSEKVAQLLKEKTEGPQSVAVDPKTGQKVYIKVGRFGAYVQLGDGATNGNGEAAAAAAPAKKGKGKAKVTAVKDESKPKRVSLPKGMTPEDVTEEIALGLLSLPRPLGTHPESGKTITAGLGRFGPFVACDGEFRSLQKGDDVLTVGLERALALFAEAKAGGKGGRRGPAQLREVGAHPTDGAPIALMSGRYGAYVTHGGINATLPKGADPATLSLDDAMTLLQRKIEAGPSQRPKKRGRRAAAAAEATPKKRTAAKKK